MKILKKLSISIMILCVTVIAYACSDKVSVGSLYFTESEISICVGDNYSPQLSVLPNAATDKSYTLSSSNTTVFIIVGSDIKAVGAGSAYLTATSNDGGYQSSILVTVYEQPVSLSTPTLLRYNSGVISFNAVPLANGYTVMNNGVEYDIGNTTNFFDYDIGSNSELKVKANGNGVTTTDSEYSDIYYYHIMPSVTNITLTDGVIGWDNDDYDEYEISIGSTVLNVEGHTDISAYLTDVGVYDISIVTIASDIDGYNVYDSTASTYQVSRLGMVTGASIIGGELYFGEVLGADAYRVMIDGDEYIIYDNNMTLPSLDDGNYDITIYAIADNALDSESVCISVTVMSAATITITNNVINIYDNNNTGHYLYINGIMTDIGSANTYTIGSNYIAGEYEIKVISYSTDSDGYYIDSTYSNTINVTKLSSVSGISVIDEVLYIDDNNDYYYNVNIGEYSIYTYEKSIDISQYLTNAGAYSVYVVSTMSGYINSERSDALNITVLADITGLDIVNGQIVYDDVSLAEYYSINISGIDDDIITENNYLDFDKTLSAGRYNVTVFAVGNGSNIISGNSSYITDVVLLDMPQIYNNGNTILWSNVNGAYGYAIYIDGIHITDTYDTQYTVDYNVGENNIGIVAYGDNGKVIDSNISNTYTLYGLEKVTNINVIDKVISFDNIDNADSYEIYINGDIYDSYDLNEYNFSNSGEYVINVIAKGSGVYLDSDNSDNYVITKYITPSAITMIDDVLYWTGMTGAEYNLIITNTGNTTIYMTLSDNYYDILSGDIFDVVGNYKVYIQYNGDNSVTIDSDISDVKTITKLPTITGGVSISGNMISFNAVSLASGYDICIDDNISSLVYSGDSIITAEILSGYDGGYYSISLQAKGNENYISSNYSDNDVIYKLITPEISYEDNVLSWQNVEGASYYNIIINRGYAEEIVISNYTSNTFMIDDEILSSIYGGDIYIEIQARASGALYSEYSNVYTIYRLAAPNIYIDNGSIMWDTVSGAIGYAYYINGEYIDTYSSVIAQSLEGYTAGIEYSVSVMAISSVDGDYADSPMVSYTVYKQSVPTISIIDGALHISYSSTTTLLYLKIGDTYMTIFATPIYDLGLSDIEGLLIGESTEISIMALGDYESIVNSDMSDVIYATKRSSPTGLSMTDNVLYWDCVNNTDTYEIKIVYTSEMGMSEQVLYQYITEERFEWPDEMIISGVESYQVYLRVIGDSEYISSDYCNALDIYKLSSPISIRSESGVLYWNSDGDTLPNGYEIVIDNEYTFTMSEAINYYTLPSTIGDGYHSVIIRATGNDGNIMDSEYTDIYSIIYLPTISSPTLNDDGYLQFYAPYGLFSSAVINMSSVFSNYTFTISIDDLTAESVYELSSYSDDDISIWDFDNYFSSSMVRYTYYNTFDILPDIYNFNITLIGNTESITDVSNNIISTITGESSMYGEDSYTMLPYLDISIIYGDVSWSISDMLTQYVYDDEIYDIVLTKIGVESISYYDDIHNIDFNNDGIDTDGDDDNNMLFTDGRYSISLRIKGNAEYIMPAYNDTAYVTILSSVTVTQSSGIIYWSKVTSATQYYVNIVDSIGNVNEFYTTSTSLDMSGDEYISGLYYITVTAIGNDTDIIDSKVNNTYEKTKLDIMEYEYQLTDGVLQWKKVTDIGIYIININGNDIYIDVSNNSNISVYGDYYRYILDEDYDSETEYTIYMQAIGDNNNTLTSSISESITATKLNIIDNIEVTNGSVSWQWSGELNTYYNVELSFYVNGVKVIYTFDWTLDTYVMPDSIVIGSTYQLSGGEYYIRVRVQGNNQYYSSSYSEYYTINRLDDISNITASNGIIVWDSVYNDAVYTISIDNQTIVSTDNYIDLMDYDYGISGVFYITIYAQADGYIDSRVSSTIRYERIGTVTDISNDDNSISWSDVDNAAYYMLKIEKYSGDSLLYTNYDYSYTTEYDFGDYDDGLYRVYIRAIADSGLYISGIYSESISITKAEQVSDLTLYEDNKYWQWSSVSGAIEYQLTYTYTSFDTYQSITKYLTLSNEELSFRTIELGVYTGLTISAVTSGGIAGEPAVWTGSYVFDSFAGGDGSENNPYQISTVLQWYEITYFADAYFVQTANILMGSISQGIEYFEGHYDGDGYSIQYQLYNTSSYKALFEITNGAYFVDVKIAQSSISGSVSAYNLYAGMLIASATNTTLDNVDVTDSSIVSNISQTSAVYVGGVIGYGSNIVIYGSDVELQTNISATGTSGYIYVGGIIANIDEYSEVGDIIVSHIDNSTSLSKLYIGGISATNYGYISKVYADIEYNSGDYIGGITADNNAGDIYYAEAYGSIYTSNISYVGGISGLNQNGAEINYSYSIVNITLSISQSSGITSYAGGIVGYNQYSTIYECWNAGDISVEGTATKGAIAGYSSSGISNCYYTGVSGDSPIGSGNYNGTQQTMTLEQMMSEDFVQTLNTNNEIYVYVSGSTPIMEWRYNR